MKSLGELKKIDVRTVWTSEHIDFTPWLAQNIALIGQTIGMELELEARERHVGPFRADLLAKDLATDNWVLIENQLEKTDHCHLGQLITYAAGLKAVTIIWIADRFIDEHSAALDWLNEITDEGINFFGLEIELWRIGESEPAPKLNVVSRPNVWQKARASEARALDTEYAQRYEQAKEILSTRPEISTRKLAKEIGCSTGSGLNYIRRFRQEMAEKAEDNTQEDIAQSERVATGGD